MSWFFSSLPYSFPSAGASAFTLFVFPLLSHPLLIRRELGGEGSLHGRVRYNDVAISGPSPNPI